MDSVAELVQRIIGFSLMEAPEGGGIGLSYPYEIRIPRREVAANQLTRGEARVQLTERHHEYWRKNLVITAILLFIWFVVTFVEAWYRA